MTNTNEIPASAADELAELIKGLNIASQQGDTFAASLLAGRARYGSWTSKQLPWVQKIAHKALHPEDAPKGEKLGGDLTGIVEKFKTARIKLAHPKLLFFNIGGAQKVGVSLAPDTGKNPGCLYVKADGGYAGKISPSGEFFGGKFATPELKTFLHAFAADPVGVGAQNGKNAGCCCYCSRELTDARSLEAGYGPKCAQNWELPWGGKS